MFRKSAFVIISAIGVLFAIYVVFLGMQKIPPPPIQFPAPKSPYEHYIVGSGIIESNTENVSIGTSLSEVITDVYVKAGEIVEGGAPLFRLDLRSLNAQLAEALAAKDVAFASFHRLLMQPRPEDVPPVQAQVDEARTNFENEQTRLELYESLSDPRALSLDAMNQQWYTTELANYQLAQATAQLDLLLAGAWIEDLKIASAQVNQAEATAEQVRVEIEKSTIRAPFKGQVLQVNVRKGEYAMATTFLPISLPQPPQPPPFILFGSVEPLHIRVDVDEEDAWRVRMGAKATAYVRGNSSILTPLEFVRFEPFVVPKVALTGEPVERVDTRVLQLIYRFEKKELPVYLGEIMDVYVEAETSRQ